MVLKMVLRASILFFSPLLSSQRYTLFFSFSLIDFDPAFMFCSAFTSVCREVTNLICLFASFVEAGLYCCMNRRYKFHLLAYKFC